MLPECEGNYYNRNEAVPIGNATLVEFLIRELSSQTEEQQRLLYIAVASRLGMHQRGREE